MERCNVQELSESNNELFLFTNTGENNSVDHRANRTFFLRDDLAFFFLNDSDARLESLIWGSVEREKKFADVDNDRQWITKFSMFF